MNFLSKKLWIIIGSLLMLSLISLLLGLEVMKRIHQEEKTPLMLEVERMIEEVNQVAAGTVSHPKTLAGSKLYLEPDCG